MKKKIILFTVFEGMDQRDYRDMLPYFHKNAGGGNIKQFLKQQRDSGYTGIKGTPILKP